LFDMRRREFMALLCGAAVWPLTARAQQPAMPVIGFLDPTFHEAYADRLRAFRQGLKDTGYIEGEKVTILYRSAEKSIRSTAGTGCGIGSPTGHRDCRGWW
jgi:putative ABC transport system substrate-binding protein